MSDQVVLAAERSHGQDCSRGSVIVPEGLRLEPYELATAELLKQLGYHVAFNPINNGVNAKNPDVTIDGEFWELKSLRGASKNTIAHQFSRAAKQAPNLVVDLARTGLPVALAIAQLSRRFYGQKRLVRLIVIDKEGRLTELSQGDSL